MKFALGAAAAITGASALIYLLLRPKRHLDPGKRRHGAVRSVSSSEETGRRSRTEGEFGSIKGGDESYSYRNYNGHVKCSERSSTKAVDKEEGKNYSDYNGEDLSLDSSISDICGDKKHPVSGLERELSLDGDDNTYEKDFGQTNITSEAEVVGQHTQDSDVAAQEITSVDDVEDEVSKSVFELEASENEKTPQLLKTYDDKVEEEIVSSTLTLNESPLLENEIKQGVLDSSFGTEDNENVVSSTDHEAVSFRKDLLVAAKDEEKGRLLSDDVNEVVSSSNIIEASCDSVTDSLSSECSELSNNQSESPAVSDKFNFEQNASLQVIKCEADIQPLDVCEQLKEQSKVVGKTGRLLDQATILEECSSTCDGKEEGSGGLSCGDKSCESEKLDTRSADVALTNGPRPEAADLIEGELISSSKYCDYNLSPSTVAMSSTKEDGIESKKLSTEMSLQLSEDAVRKISESKRDSNKDEGINQPFNTPCSPESTELSLEKGNDLITTEVKEIDASVPCKLKEDKILASEETVMKSEERPMNCEENVLELEGMCSKSTRKVLELGKSLLKTEENPDKHLESDRDIEVEDPAKRTNENLEGNLSQNYSDPDANEIISQVEVTAEAVEDVAQKRISGELEISASQESDVGITKSSSSASGSEGKHSYKGRVRNSRGPSESSTSESAVEAKEIEAGCNDWELKGKDCEGNLFESSYCMSKEESSSSKGTKSHHNQSSSDVACNQNESQVEVSEQSVADTCDKENKEALSKDSSASDSEAKRSYKARVRNSRGPSESAVEGKEVEDEVKVDLDQAGKELFSLISDTQDNSKTSFVVKEKPVVTVSSKAASHPVQEVADSTKDTSKSLKQESTPKKSSKSKKEVPPKTSENVKREVPPKASENMKNRSYRDRIRNSRGNSMSENSDKSEVGDQTIDNNNRNSKYTEVNHIKEVEPETLFNPSAFPVTSQETSYIFYEFEIPQVLVGRLIGRKGAFVNKIKAATDASIIVGPHRNRKFKMCSVEGTKQQVEAALDMIREYFPLDRYPELTLNQVHSSSPGLPPMHTVINNQAMQIELAMGVVVEVRVSAVASGNEIWVQQPLHPSYSALQRLQSCMNLNYADGSTTPQIPGPIPERTVCVAQIDSQWYRCQVLSATEDAVLVVLLDIGGMLTLPASALRQIRRDYATLPFQATQCLLNGIQPLSEEGWDDTSTACLEELVSGMILSATVVSYTPDGVPLVNLYRYAQNELVFINERLVTLGRAQWITPATSS